uniref:Uncharacterized protein n=1 Tax=Neobodo designis TaxID=312471 RepID=A0A7S1Q7D2_NEODS|mmetsp:Transcript_34059/g.105185  ORF Transcript_34059/g.105185 Transcript_34059/m.105185 type:complete len:1080 (+) Transcript_34059:65-3304(+)
MPPKRAGAKAGKSAPAPKRDQWFDAKAADEDIDDDLAFDSDDDKQFGAFFKQQAARAKAEKAAKKKGGTAPTGGDEAGGFDEWDDEDGASGSDAQWSDDDDDSRSEIDISELLDTKEERAERRQERQAKKAAEKKSADPVAKKAAGKAGASKGRMLEGAESMLLAPEARRSKTSLAELASATKKAIAGDDAEADAATKERLANLTSVQGLIGRELTEQERHMMDRGLARDATRAEMAKWKSFISEQRRSRTVSFPLKAPNQNPVPTTLAGIASIQQERIAKAAALLKAAEKEGDSDAVAAAAAQPAAAPASAVVSMAAKMNELLAASGLGTTKEHKRLAREQKASGATAGASAAAADGRPTSAEGFADADGFLPVTGEETVGDETAKEEGPDMTYVAKLKALVGYDLAKRKRFNKIKSKAYRRILRKEKERERELKERALELVNPEAARKKAQAKIDKMRAEERTTQRHKNTSKWVRHVKHMAKFDDDAKDAIREQDVLRQRLMAKADEAADDELIDAAEAESSDEEQERRVDELLSGKAPVSSVLWGGAAEADSDPEGLDDADGDDKRAKLRKARKELGSMDFMKRARERHAEQFRSEAAELQADIARFQRGEAPQGAGFELDSDDGLDAEERAERKRVAAEDRAGGLDFMGLRDRQEKAAAAVKERRKREGEAEARRMADLKSTEAGSGRKRFGANAAADDGGRAAPRVDVELAAPGGMVAGEGQALTPAERRRLQAEVAAREAQPAAATTKAGRKKAREAAAAAAEALVDDGGAEDEDAVMGTSGAESAPSPKSALRKSAAADAATTAPLSGKEKKRVRVETADAAATATKSPPSKPRKAEEGAQMSHDYLVSRAFARDDIDEDFTAAKAAQVEEALKPEDANASLPGWGEWGGESERLNRNHKQRVAENALKRSIERSALASARADAKLDHAIINHDVGMVADKHTLHVVPRPYDSAVQYERAMRQPLGPEFNSVRTFQDGVAPKVQTKKGVAIDPVDRTTGMHKKAKTSRSKKSDLDDELAETALVQSSAERKAAAKEAAAQAAASAKAKKEAAAKKASAGKRDGARLKNKRAR